MLKKILQEMYIAPEILEGLDEDDKQILFCKMREEQIRRWKEFDMKCELEEKNNFENTKSLTVLNKNKKNVTFLIGEDNEPWVWVMGEHENDKKIEELLEDEAKINAFLIAKNELLNENNNEVKEIENEKQLKDNYDKNFEIYSTVEEAVSSNNNNSIAEKFLIEERTNDNLENKCKFALDKIDEKSIDKSTPKGKVSAKIAQWEEKGEDDSLTERTSQIFNEIQMKKHQIDIDAEKNAELNEKLWEEQERKAKEAEVIIRNIARRAREEHRRSSMISGNVIDWYEKLGKPYLNPDETTPEWFHGMLDRTNAEDLLNNQTDGTFLVRVSESSHGYAISYKCSDKFKHYLIDVVNGKYKFLGENQFEYSSLEELVKFHTCVPITKKGNELLLNACPKMQS